MPGAEFRVPSSGILIFYSLFTIPSLAYHCDLCQAGADVVVHILRDAGPLSFQHKLSVEILPVEDGCVEQGDNPFRQK